MNRRSLFFNNDFTREIPPVFEIFSDRMEFTSYGGLISGQSKEDFFSCSSMPRNRELMRVFKDVGLVEQLGSGMSRILKYYDRDIFEISDHFIKVVFPFCLSSKMQSIILKGYDCFSIFNSSRFHQIHTFLIG